MNLKSSLRTLVGASLLAGAVFTMAPAMAVSSNDCVTSPLLSTCVNVQTGSTGTVGGGGGGGGGATPVVMSIRGFVDGALDAVQGAFQDILGAVIG